MDSNMVPHYLILPFLLLNLCFGVLQAKEETSSSSNINAADNNPIIQWLRSKEGGYFSEKIGLEDQSGAGGMFALQDIEEGEHLMTIPPSALLIGEEEDSNDYDEDGFGRESCLTAKKLYKEYTKLGETKSEYWPYVQYVFESFPHETIPMGWSKEGKQLIRDIAGEELDPHEFGEGSYLWSCGYTEDRNLEDEYDDDTIDPKKRLELLEAAWRIVEARGWYHVLVPVLDMVNHRNGKWLNVDRENPEGYQSDDSVLDVEDDYKVIALRDIPKGTPLHNSYNQCLDITCLGIDKFYLTPGVFADYGFVEQYPRRFAFHTGHEPEEPPEDFEKENDEDDEYDPSFGLLIEIDIVDDNQQQEKLGITWLNGKPNSDQIAWVEKERKRLLGLDVEERSKALANGHEGRMSLEYYHALLSAMDLVIQAGPGGGEAANEEDKSEL